MRVNVMSTTGTAAALADIQRALYSPRTGLHAHAMSRRRTPDGFSAELHRDLAMFLQRAMFEEWRMSQFLPTDCANDAQPVLPGAA